MDANGGVDLSDGVLTLSVLFRAEGELRGLYSECEWGACEADSSSCLK